MAQMPLDRAFCPKAEQLVQKGFGLESTIEFLMFHYTTTTTTGPVARTALTILGKNESSCVMMQFAALLHTAVTDYGL